MFLPSTTYDEIDNLQTSETEMINKQPGTSDISYIYSICFVQCQRLILRPGENQPIVKVRKSSNGQKNLLSLISNYISREATVCCSTNQSCESSRVCSLQRWMKVEQKSKTCVGANSEDEFSFKQQCFNVYFASFIRFTWSMLINN